jgi:uncharacterized protein
MTLPRQLVVSIHDVSPPEWGRAARMLARLEGAGVRRCSLLVIPNFQGKWPLDRHAAFCDWLRQRQDEGHEIVLHGYEHIGVGQPRTLYDRFRNRWYTQGEGEFLSLDYEQASGRIERGLALLLESGLHVYGFVAPAWLINRDGLRAAANRGLQYTNSYLRLVDLQSRTSCFAPSLVFGPGSLNEDVAVGVQRRLSGAVAALRLVRVVLHPPCIDHPVRFDRILAMIAAQLRSHEAATYLESLSCLRPPAAAVGSPGHAH